MVVYADLPALARARLDADTMRAEWLIGVTSEILTVPDLIEQSLTDEGAPLRKITLRQLLLAQPRWGRKRVKETLEKVRATLGTSIREREMTVGWLTDVRYDGKNMLAWIDAFTPRTTAPWVGFPLAPQPVTP